MNRISTHRTRRTDAICSLFALVAAGACRRDDGRAASDDARAPTTTATTTATATATATSTTTILDDGGAATVASAPATTVDVIFAGDAIPQQKVLAVPIADVLAGLPKCWLAADARVLNLEAPIGARDRLPSDKNTLAFAAPPSWFADLYAASRASAFVVANNHACDLGPAGLANTVAEAAKLSAPVIGAGATDPWTRVEVVEKSGRRVCVVAWTTFLNDKGRKQQSCIDGDAGAKVARAELGREGLETIDRELGRPDRWVGCDARVAIVHGGREYKPQIHPVLEQARAAAAYVDAVIIAHPHVPDLVELVRAQAPPASAHGTPELGGRVAGRGVPIYRSLGNFVSNQGIAWTRGMTLELPEIDGQADSLRTVWTRLVMFARVRFSWDEGAPPASAPTHVFYGYSLAFTERDPVATIRLRALASVGDPIGERLATGMKPFSELLRDRCRLDGPDPDAAPTCEATPR